ncbi:YciI family protein [Iamia majanohamensis]|uniref:YciI family protein n=1 Tax=Iamia majanohamensis TaxID=467976 RepID=A0AAF0BXV9_9ACTN|nr:YciI family protein [Iamia majanohamensis]WCO69249.1 YciI family protein [Iamia majanohamensis]
MLMIYGNTELWESLAPEDMEALVRETDAHNTALVRSGEMVGAYGVADQAQARQVHVVDGSPVVTDGPYIEAKEYLGSFTIVDCESEERALELAAANPFARLGQIEVRPLLHEAPTDL